MDLTLEDVILPVLLVDVLKEIKGKFSSRYQQMTKR